MAKPVSKHSIEDLAKALKEARENGPQVVPIVGAGLSADSGFPIIAAVVHYLGKLRHYIALRGPVYDYRKPNGKDDIFDRHFARYEAKRWSISKTLDGLIGFCLTRIFLQSWTTEIAPDQSVVRLKTLNAKNSTTFCRTSTRVEWTST
jgi:hypothetical protein